MHYGGPQIGSPGELWGSAGPKGSGAAPPCESFCDGLPWFGAGSKGV